MAITLDSISDEPISKWDDISAREIAKGVSDSLANLFENKGGLGSISVMRNPSKTVADSSLLMKICSVSDEPLAVLHCSQKTSPGLVAREARFSQEAAEKLGKTYGDHVLTPLLTGEVNKRSYAVYPWRQVLSNSRFVWRIQREILYPYLADWLINVARRTKREATEDEIQENFIKSLQHVCAHSKISNDIKELANQALIDLENNKWTPLHILDHNDFWKGNFLLPNGWFAYPRFQIIDWGAANQCGYGVHDLVVLAGTINISNARFQKALNSYMLSLGLDKNQLLNQFLACMGYLGRNLEYFPEERYLIKFEQCVSKIQYAIS